ncbi:hypothetical protein SNK05_003231 [Fusarium graminearum]
MDFAPYQSSPPEHSRVTSPDYTSPRPSYDARRSFSPVASPPPLQHPQPQRGWGGFDGQSTGWAAISPDSRAFGASSRMPGFMHGNHHCFSQQSWSFISFFHGQHSLAGFSSFATLP